MKKLFLICGIMLVCGVTAQNRQAVQPDLSNQDLLQLSIDSLGVASEKLESSTTRLNNSLTINSK